MKTWQDIWESKELDSTFEIKTEKETIRTLLKCNGFDSKSGSLGILDYLNFIISIAKKIQDCKSIYEVGCGAGAFLYTLNIARAYSLNRGGADEC